MKIDRVGAFFREKTPRRLLALAVFGAAIFAFRELFVLLAFFVAFERSLGALSGWIAKKTRWSKRISLLAVFITVVGAAVTGGILGAKRIGLAITHARDHVPERIAEIEATPLFKTAHEHLPGIEKLVETAGHYAADIFHAAAAVGHALLYALIGLILAIVFLIEEKEVEEWRETVSPSSIIGTLARWLGHITDAISVTLQVQLIVALCNTLLTFPLLFWLGAPHKIALMLLIFASGLIPVVGNVISGAVLSFLAYHTRGVPGVVVFVLLTFALHKLEAYYLNPRLTSRHVKLPGFLIIMSLLAWEHLIGLAGLFASFPFLFVAGRIRAEMKAEDKAEEEEQDGETTPGPTSPDD